MSLNARPNTNPFKCAIIFSETRDQGSIFYWALWNWPQNIFNEIDHGRPRWSSGLIRHVSSFELDRGWGRSWVRISATTYIGCTFSFANSNWMLRDREPGLLRDREPGLLWSYETVNRDCYETVNRDCYENEGCKRCFESIFFKCVAPSTIIVMI